MNCEVAHERIALAAYGELADDQTHELQRHLVACPECQQEREQVMALKLLADAWPVSEPEANFIARSRLRLEEALDALPPRRWYDRLSQKLLHNFADLQAAPLAACLLLLIGTGAGVLGGYQYAQTHTAELVRTANQTSGSPFENASMQGIDSISGTQSAEVANVSRILRTPNSNIVEVRYNQVVPRQISGSINDPSIRQLLMLASENSPSVGVRDDSVGLLADECRTGKGCQGIRNALLVALRVDRNSTVRMKALDGLAPYVSQDTGVRDAVLEALLGDTDARIRSRAIAILVPVEADTSVRQALSTVATSDQSVLIRTASRNVLSKVPEIQ